MSRMLRAGAVLAAGMLAGGQSASAATFDHLTTKDGIELIGIEGEIAAGDDDRFRALSLRYKSAVILLDSGGGAIVPALEIGRIIRIAGYSTVVPEQATCASACALIWLAGSRRLLSPKGRLGFHASYANVDGKPTESGVANALVGSYLTQLNLPQRAIVFTTQAAPDQISWLTEQNKDFAGIDFETLIPDGSPTRPAPSKARANVQAAPAESGPPKPTLEQLTLEMKAKFRSPQTVDQVVKSFGMDPEYDDLFKHHVNSLYANDLYIERLTREIYPIFDTSKNTADAFETSRKLGQEISLKLSYSGIARLNDENIKSFIYYLLAIPTNLPDTECKSALSANGSSAATEYRAIAKLGRDHLANYLTLQRRGIEAELSNYPSTTTFSKDQSASAQEAYAATLDAALAKLDPAESQRIANAILNLDAANAKDSCDGYYMIFKALHDLEGQPGNWSRRQLIQDIGRQ